MKRGDFVLSSDHSHLFRAKLRYVTDGALPSILIAFRIFPSQVFDFEGWTGYEILLYTVHTSFIAHEVRRQTGSRSCTESSTFNVGNMLTVPRFLSEPHKDMQVSRAVVSTCQCKDFAAHFLLLAANIIAASILVAR